MNYSYPKNWRRGVRVFFWLIVIVFTSALSAQTVSFTVLNGEEIRCYPDSLVRIEITPNPGFEFTEIFVDWGHDDQILTINPGDPLIIEHEFPLAQFEGECTYGAGCGGPFANTGFCFQVGIDALYGGATQPENVSKRITFQFPPEPAFAPRAAFICAGTEVQIANLTCPENDENMRYYWTFPNDLGTSMEEEPTITFPDPGDYAVTLTAVNNCDSVTTVSLITVNSLPEAVARLDSGSVATVGPVDTVCLAFGGKARLNGTASVNAATYSWAIQPNNGFMLDGPNNLDTLRVQFTEGGNYRAILTVDNDCDAPDKDTVDIYVLPLISLFLNEQEDVCEVLSYAPDPLFGDATYRVAGMTLDSAAFPVNLSPRNEPYVVVARSVNNCQTLEVRDTFVVFGPVQPAVVEPLDGAALCRENDLLPLIADPPGGVWSGEGVASMGDDFFFNLDQEAGDYTLTYTLGVDACERTVTTTVTLQSPEVNVAGPDRVCATDSPVNLTFSPGGGEWSGPGISDPAAGTFDPATADVGTNELTYTFVDSGGSGCTVSLGINVEVVATPAINNLPADLFVCAIDDELSLSQLTGVSFSPSGGTVSWTGPGVTGSDGTYNPAVAGSPPRRDTLTVSYEIEPGCLNVATLPVQIDTATAVDAGPDRTVCENESNPVLTASLPGGRWEGPGIDPGTGEVDLSALDPGDTYLYTYFLNEATPSCTVSDDLRLTVAPGAGVSIPVTSIYVCDTAQTVTLPQGDPNGGTWSGLSGISGNTVDVGGLNPATYPLTYRVDGLPAACNSADLDLVILAKPTLAVSGDSVGCAAGDCLSFLATTGADDVTWSFGDGATDSGTEVCHPFAGEGRFTVRGNAILLHPQTDQEVCRSDPATLEVDVRGELPIVMIVPEDTVGCAELILDFAPGVIDDRFEYRWTSEGLVDTNLVTLENLFFPSTAEDTTYQIQLTTSNGCDVRLDSISVRAQSAYRARIAAPTLEVCSGDTLSIFNLSTGGPAVNPLWRIDGRPDFFGFEPMPFVVFTGNEPDTVNVTYFGANGCNADTASLRVVTTPTDVRAEMAFADDEVCAGSPLLLSNISTPGAPVRWTTSTGDQFLGDTITPVFNVPGTVWVEVTATGCGFDRRRREFTVLPAPRIGLDFSTTACAETPVDFLVTGDADAQWLYFGTGDSSFLNSTTYVYDSTGIFPLRVVGRSVAGCVDSLFGSIEVIARPRAAVAPVDSLCSGESLRLVSVSDGAQSCTWRFFDDGRRDGCTADYRFEGAGLTTNRLTVTSALGCRDSVDFPVFVRPTPVADFRVDAGTECFPVEIDVTYVGTGANPTSWTYSLGDGTVATRPDFNHRYASGGTYPVTLTVSVDGICSDTLSRDIQLRGTPRLDTLTEDLRCLPSEAFVLEVDTDFENEVTVFGPGYREANLSRYEIVGAGAYTVEVLSPGGCDTVLTVPVPEIIPITVELMPDTLIRLGQSVRIRSTINMAGLTFNWTPLDGLTDSLRLEPLATPTVTTEYVLTATDGRCVAADSVVIQVDARETVFVPNVFSPNADGRNDFIRPLIGPGIEEVESVRIYTRWGGVVYSCDGSCENDQGWDGRINGKYLNPQVLVYEVTFRQRNGDRVTEYGELTLLR